MCGSFRLSLSPLGRDHEHLTTFATHHHGLWYHLLGDKHFGEFPWVINITYRDTLKPKMPKLNGYVLNYVILTAHSSHLYSMWDFTYTCNPTPWCVICHPSPSLDTCLSTSCLWIFNPIGSTCWHDWKPWYSSS